MPTNLPPDYFEAEKKYRAAQTVSEKIIWLEEMLSIMPKHKGTDKLKADLRRRLSKLKISPQSKKTSRRDSAFRIDREGAGQTVILGPANVGKSSLIAVLTNASPDISPNPYTTWSPTPGMMEFNQVQIQLIDTPPLDREFVEPAMFDLIRRTDLVLIVVDLQTDPFQQLEETVEILRGNRILPSHWQHISFEDRSLVYKPFLVAANKCDDVNADENFQIFQELLEDECEVVPISTTTRRNLDTLMRTIYKKMNIIRVYTKSHSKDPDLNAPFVLKYGSTVEELAGKIHHDFLNNLKTARVWGADVFDGQMVGRDYILQDGDVIELSI